MEFIEIILVLTLILVGAILVYLIYKTNDFVNLLNHYVEKIENSQPRRTKNDN